MTLPRRLAQSPRFARFARLAATVGFSLGLMSQGASAQTTAQTTAPAAPHTLQVYNADAGSFHVNAVLVAGKTDAVLLDTGFTRADALRIAALVLDSRKALKTIYISQADPDFYFGLEVLKQVFPEAQVLSTAATRKKIEATLATKLQVWGPRMGANAPKAVPLPAVLSGHTIDLEGQALEIRGLDDGLPGRSYVWIPSIRAMAGGPPTPRARRSVRPGRASWPTWPLCSRWSSSPATPRLAPGTTPGRSPGARPTWPASNRNGPRRPTAPR